LLKIDCYNFDSEAETNQEAAEFIKARKSIAVFAGEKNHSKRNWNSSKRKKMITLFLSSLQEEKFKLKMGNFN